MKIIVFLLFMIMLFSCDFRTDCKALEEHYRNDEECSMIVEIPPKPSSVFFKAIGKTLDNKKCVCEEESRWWAIFSDKIEKGDTIIKRKGELVFEIHKKDTILVYNWECEGKKYK
jgi:hypothetical protein